MTSVNRKKNSDAGKSGGNSQWNTVKPRYLELDGTG